MSHDDTVSVKYKAALPKKKFKKNPKPTENNAVSLKNERENVLFQTNGEVAAPVRVTIKDEGSLRTRGGKAEQPWERPRRREAGNSCKPGGAGRRVLLPAEGRGPAAGAAPGAVALQGAGGRRTRAGGAAPPTGALQRGNLE